MKLWLMATVLLAASAAQSQTVWRCGPDGRSYADTPCREGRAVDMAEARPAADLSGAKDLARREHALAARLVQERRLRQAEPTAGPGLAGIRSSRLAPGGDVATATGKNSRGKNPQDKRKHRPEGPGTWHAVAPASRPAKD